MSSSQRTPSDKKDDLRLPSEEANAAFLMNTENVGHALKTERSSLALSGGPSSARLEILERLSTILDKLHQCVETRQKAFSQDQYSSQDIPWWGNRAGRILRHVSEVTDPAGDAEKLYIDVCSRQGYIARYMRMLSEFSASMVEKLDAQLLQALETMDATADKMITTSVDLSSSNSGQW